MPSNYSRGLQKLRTGQIQGQRQLTTEQERMLRYVVGNMDEFRTVSTKLVSQTNIQKASQQTELPRDALVHLSSKASNDIKDINMIKLNLPEIETIKDILVSSILSPNDMLTEELAWSTTGDGFPQQLGGKMLDLLKDHFTTEYNLNERLSTFLGNALFDQGSHILAVFPESSIDDIINNKTESSLESFQSELAKLTDKSTGNLKEVGILGNGILGNRNKYTQPNSSNKFSLENFFNPQLHDVRKGNVGEIIPGLLGITDNIDLVKTTSLQRKLVQLKMNRYYQPTVSLESIYFNPAYNEEEQSKLPANQFYRDVKQRSFKGVSIVNDRNSSSRKSVGHPLVLDLPHESCIPVFVPGNPKDHLGYLVLLDQLGNPVTYTSEQDNLDNMESNFNKQYNSAGNGSYSNGAGVVTQTLTEMSNIINGPQCPNKQATLSQLTQFYTEMVERDLKARLNDGIFGENIEIARPDEIYRIMLARALSGSYTQLLYIPSTLVTYIAFHYNEFGMGESLITKNKTLAALRIATMYANNTAIIKNATGHKVMTVKLDPDDEDKDWTIASVINRQMEANSMTSLFSTYDPRKIEGVLFRHGFDIIIEGDEGFETTAVEMEYKQGEHPTIDNEFAEQQRDEFISGFQIPAEAVTNSSQAEFAVEAVSRNVLFNKRNRTRAIAFNTFLKDHVCKYILHDGKLINELSDLIRKEYTLLGEELLEEVRKTNSTIPAIEAFLDTIEIGVPLQEGESGETVKKAYDNYKTLVDEFVPVFMDSDVLSNIIKEEDKEKKNDIINSIQDRVKNLMLSNWIRNNNAFSEMDTLLSSEKDESGNITGNSELMKWFVSQQDTIAQAFGDVIADLYAQRNPSDDDSGGSNYSSDDSATSTTEGDGTGDEFSSTDDTSEEMGEDTTTEEEPNEVEDTSEEEEESTEEDTDTESDEDTSTEEESTDDLAAEADALTEDSGDNKDE